MSVKFIEFANEIIKKSKLDVTGGLATKYFEEYIVSGMGSKLWEFQEKARVLFEEWDKRAGSFLSIADFFKKRGSYLFKLWLTEIFPFNQKYLIVDCKKHSAVDSQLAICYYFHKDEINTIKNILFMNNLKGKSEKDGAIFLFTNAIKSISKYFTLLIKKEYKIFTSSLESIKIEDDIISIDFKGAGRVKQ